MDAFNEIATKYFDITDRETRKSLMNVNEAEKNQVMNSLASKLYDSIIDKIYDIDYETIMQSEGDITKVENYSKMIDCIAIMKQYLEAGQQDVSFITTIETAVQNISARKEIFMKAFKYEIELPMVTYNTITLACIASISLMISCCVEFIKGTNDDTFEIVVNNVSKFKSQNSLLYKNLEKFNKSCSDGSLDKALNTIINSKVKKLTGEVVVGILTGVAIIALILGIIPAIRELIFLFYYTRVKVSDYFAIQADLLEVNANNIEYNSTLDAKKRKEIKAKQAKVISRFRKISNTLEVKMKEAESKANKELSNSNKKYKISDVTDKMPDTAAASSTSSSDNSLF